MSPSRGVLLIAACVCALIGCDVDEDGNRKSEETDRLPSLVIDSSPTLALGVVYGDEFEEFGGISDATRRPDGTVVVANCRASELRFFDQTGEHVRTVGRRGDGPGEFAYIRRIFPHGGDTIGVFDGAHLRISVVLPDGEVFRTISLGRAIPQFPDVLGRLDNGSYIARRDVYEFGAVDRVPDADSYRTTNTLLLLDQTGRASDSVAGLPALDMEAEAILRGRLNALRLSRAAVFAVHPQGVFYGGQDTAGILEFDAQLDRIRTTRPITGPAPVTSEAREEFQRTLEDAAHVGTGGVVPVQGNGYAPSMPAFGDLVAGRDGRLWVQDPARPGEHPLGWTAYENGKAAARVQVPSRFFPFEFGRDWVLGATFDENTVEGIELWSLVPGEHRDISLTPGEAAPPILPRCGAWVSR